MSANRDFDFCRRLLSKVELNAETGCWEWTACIQSNGYGRVWDGEKVGYAHRIVYSLYLGEPPEGLDLDHLCRNRRCVNPNHLEPVTRSENLRRGDTGENIARPLREKKFCPSGHPYSGSNLTKRNGRRHCKACARIRYHRRKIANG